LDYFRGVSRKDAKGQRGKEKKRIDGVGLKTLLANIIKAIVAPEKYGY